MSILLRFLGALILAYFVRWAVLRITEQRLAPLASVIVANAVAGALLGIGVGLIKSTMTPFNASAALFYVAPQLCWLVFDLWRVGAFQPKTH